MDVLPEKGAVMGAVTADVRRGPTRAPLMPLRSSILAALPAWLAARVLVFATLLLALRLRGADMTAGPWSGARTLQVWDAIWYRDLAENGYLSHGPAETRFFPLLPALVGAGHRLGLPAGALLTALCWAAALAFAAALHRLVLVETGDEPAARRAAWLIQLVPGANVLVLGYTEALAGLLAVGFFLVLRTRRHLALAAPLGVLSGLVRPTGLLLSVPAFIELIRSRGARPARWPLRLLVVVAPIAGCVSFLAWAWYVFGDALAPYRAQTGAELRGGVVNVQWQFLIRSSPGGYPWQLVLGLLVTTAVLLWLCARRLPASYTMWAVCAVAAAVTAYGFHSLPRYLASIFPLVMAAALVCQNRLLWRTVLCVSMAVFARVSYLNLVPGAVP
jgi:hypothetical protein